MLRKRSQIWLHATVIGLAMVLIFSLSASTAAVDPGRAEPALMPQGFIVTDALPGALYAPGGLVSSPGHQVIGSRMPTAGPLTHEDLKRVEARARALLSANKSFRQDISPYQGEQNQFDQLVRQFDASGGFQAAYVDPAYPSVVTLEDRINVADAELRQARDMYAYLAVYADAARFRTDLAALPGCTGAPAEDPFADPPVIDWCNFASRMRESLREAAYLRMIFGQQFTADALGFTFGADIIGGEAFVREELRKLELAVAQYQLAREAVAEGLDHYLGNGCYVFSFYNQAEWALLSRAVEGLERAQHHIAVRKSYLAPDVASLPSAQAQAENVYRAAAMDQYADLLLTAYMATRPSGCERGTRPDNDLIAKMAANLLDTRQNARELQDGRNIFGFDVSFTPARPYQTIGADKGLWQQAWDAAQLAKTLQDDASNNARAFDVQATLLRNAIIDVRDAYDLRLSDLTGCSTSLPEDQFFDCVADAADALRACDPTEEDASVFNACVSGSGAGGQLREAWENVRTAFLKVKRTQQELVNLRGRRVIEMERNATVTDEILTNGREQAAMEFFATLLDSVQVTVSIIPPGASVSNNPFSPVIAGLRMGQKLRQATADITIENANSVAVVRNLLLDAVELQIDLEIAAHEANAQATVFENLASTTQDVAVEARRARAYVAQSPANDPSYRLVRDSLRLELADRLGLAARVSYLAAKRAEYEYAARLAANNFPLSDIYQARTAQDILTFLNDLDTITGDLVIPGQIARQEFTLSVAQHVLGWTDEELGLTGEDARAERARLFRAWVADNTEPGPGGKPVLVFSFDTSPTDNGVFASVIGQFFDRFWLHKVAGVGASDPFGNGFGMNLVTSQTEDLGHRMATVTQAGVVHLKAFSGCIFEYKLVHPAALLGLEWPAGQPSDAATATFEAGINGQNIARTPAFLARPVSASAWKVEIDSGSPDGILPDMDLTLLEDIQLIFDTTYGSRTPGLPDPADCIRVDY